MLSGYVGILEEVQIKLSPSFFPCAPAHSEVWNIDLLSFYGKLAIIKYPGQYKLKKNISFIKYHIYSLLCVYSLYFKILFNHEGHVRMYVGNHSLH